MGFWPSIREVSAFRNVSSRRVLMIFRQPYEFFLICVSKSWTQINVSHLVKFDGIKVQGDRELVILVLSYYLESFHGTILIYFR